MGRQELHGHEKAITSLAVTSDSSMLVSGSEDATMRTWHVASRQCVHKTEAPTKGIQHEGINFVRKVPRVLS